MNSHPDSHGHLKHAGIRGGSLRRTTQAAKTVSALFFCLLGNPAWAGEPAWWTQQKAECGVAAGTAYNDWVAQGSPCNSGGPNAPAIGSGPTTRQQIELQGAQQLGTAIGTAIGNKIGQALFGSPEDAAQEQRQIAARQLNNSGIYLLNKKDYTGAVNEFEQALSQTPDDAIIANNLAVARLQLKIATLAAKSAAAAKTQDTAAAVNNSAALGQLLGDTPASPGNVGSGQLTHASLPGPNSSALNLVNLDPGTSTVDLRGSTGTVVDPAALKSQLDRTLANSAPVSAPLNPLVQLPEDKDIELLGLDPQPAASPKPGVQLQLPGDDSMILLFPGLSQPAASPKTELQLPDDSDLVLLFPGLAQPAASPGPGVQPPESQAEIDRKWRAILDSKFQTGSELDSVNGPGDGNKAGQSAAQPQK